MSGVKTGYVETATGPVDIFAIPSAITAWNSATGSWTLVTLLANYFPATCQWLPNRGPNRAGEVVAMPTPEAAALVPGIILE